MLAYVGPGAGFALVSSFFFLFVAVILIFFSIASWPIRAFFLSFKRSKFKRSRKVKRVIVLGFDGMDPKLTTSFMNDGFLPNLTLLKNEGTFEPLKTTYPPMSPVGWSTFATGVNPGKHQIFDFFTRDKKNYIPILSSTKTTYEKKSISFFFWKYNFVKTSITLLRKSTSIWKLLSESKIFSIVLRVPITYPPEKIYGTCLSAMCTPDLRGTQGSYTFYSSDQNEYNSNKNSVVLLNIDGNNFSTEITGPEVKINNEKITLKIPLRGELNKNKQLVEIIIIDEKLILKKGEYSPWVRLDFNNGRKNIANGIVRFLLTEISEHIKIYMTPININPEDPNLPISHPFYYSISLAKVHGYFSTLGLAEDTSALNDGVIDEQAFLDQAYDIYEERKKIFLDNVKKTDEGLVVSVFDITDRVQHMFFRYMVEDHPANVGKDTVVHKNAIRDVYSKMDDLVAEVKKELRKDDLLFVVSDHGFTKFTYGVNLNTWLWKNGYLFFKTESPFGDSWLRNVDWKRTKAFAYGLTGIFVNTIDRESLGIIKRGRERIEIMQELKQRLEELNHDEKDTKAIRKVYFSDDVMKGPYSNESPDLIIGYEDGYRASWTCATGKITPQIFEPNTQRWSGDHCIDPEIVPGVLFSNSKMEMGQKPALVDLAPTIINLFGIDKQSYHDGKILNFIQKQRSNTQL